MEICTRAQELPKHANEYEDNQKPTGVQKANHCEMCTWELTANMSTYLTVCDSYRRL